MKSKRLGRISIALAALLAFGTLGGISRAAFAEGGSAVYLCDSVAVGGGSVYLPSASAYEGQPAPVTAYELINGTGNGFIRMASFSEPVASDRTTVSVELELPAAQTVTLKASYRFFEGRKHYGADEVVLTVSYRGAEQTFTYDDITPSAAGNLAWNELNLQLSPKDGYTSFSARFTFSYGSGKYSDTDTCFDLDNVTLSAGENTVSASFDDLGASDTGTLDYYFNESEHSQEVLDGYMLSPDENAYVANTKYDNEYFNNFDTGNASFMLARSGSDKMYRGAASVNAGEGDDFVLYDAATDNSFVRFANFSGKTSVATRLVCYFYNNDTNEKENIYTTAQKLYYEFDYRIYIDDVTAASLSPDSVVFYVNARNSANKTGQYKLRDLIVNQAGDDTWHHEEGVIESVKTSTSYMAFYCYLGAEEASLNPTTFVDFDNLYISDVKDRNYAYLNGAFEGMVDKSGGDAINPVEFDKTLGTPASKSSEGLNYFYTLEKGQTLSLPLNFNKTTGVYHLSFKTTTKGAFDVSFGGRNGAKIKLDVGSDIDEDVLSVHWTRSGDVYTCDAFFAGYTAAKLYTVDFVNNSENAVTIDDAFVGQVSSVTKTAGDYAKFTSSLNSLKATASEMKNSVTEESYLKINAAIVKAEKIDEYSSQERMDNALSSVSAKIDGATNLADLTELKQAIAACDEAFERGSEYYSKRSWAFFLEKYHAALNVRDTNSQAEVDAATAALTAAKAALVPDDSVHGANLIAIVIGGLLGGGTLTAGGFIAFSEIRRRRKKQ